MTKLRLLLWKLHQLKFTCTWWFHESVLELSLRHASQSESKDAFSSNRHIMFKYSCVSAT